jgi:hypothetical protein
VVVIGIDHALAANQPDGGYAVRPDTSGEDVSQKAIYIEGNGFEMGINGMTLCDLQAGFMDFSRESGNLTLNALNLANVYATAELDWYGLPKGELSAVASLYTPGVEATIPLGIFEINVTADAYIGAIGFGAEFDLNSGKFKITPPIAGVGGSIGIDFNFIS